MSHLVIKDLSMQKEKLEKANKELNDKIANGDKARVVNDNANKGMCCYRHITSFLLLFPLLVTHTFITMIRTMMLI